MPPQPPTPPTIALLSDFGLSDWFVGTMKGVILSICPTVNLVDICHEIAKHQVEEGAFILNTSHAYFPDGTIFACIVDPEVGSMREPLVAYNERFAFVAPNNGLLTFVAVQSRQWEVRKIENPAYMLGTQSQTFHGRDIFAPAAAHLAAGAPFDTFGPVV
jgi:S-adenosylmethionine hydrolase